MSLAEARQVPAADWLRILREAYADDVPGHQLIRHTSADRLQVLGSLRIMPELPHWHRGRMVLVGDAAHAPSNTSGQGASLAIESAVQLARCLRDLPDAVRLRRLRAPPPSQSRADRRRCREGQPRQGSRPGGQGADAAADAHRDEDRHGSREALAPIRRYTIDWDEPVTAAH